MSFVVLFCDCCGRKIFRSKRRVNESRRNRWKSFCSKECNSKYRMKGKQFVCSNPVCKKVVLRIPSQVKKDKSIFCSRSCSAIINNSKYPKRKAKVKTCYFCGKKYTGDAKKYCSTVCRFNNDSISPGKIIKEINDFIKRKGRIPYKREFPHYRSVRRNFGTWNKAIVASGLKPNPVKFAKKHMANDGHKCDSMAEKIIDDWLFYRVIKHEVNVPYPGSQKFTADFKVGNVFIEYFGLAGKHKRYDQLKKEKLKVANEYGLDLIKLYPHHLSPENKIGFVLQKLVN